jgi:hypothetical protein
MTTSVPQQPTAVMMSSNTLHVMDVFGADSMTVTVFPSSAESGAATFVVNGQHSVLTNMADVVAIRDLLDTLIGQAGDTGQ